MFGSEILDVAIGLALIYLLLSIICSILDEFVARIFSMRADTLEEGIRYLLNDRAAQNVARDIFEHPLISSLGSKPGGFKFLWWDFRWGGKPSYIPAKNFALALLEKSKDGAQPQNLNDLKDVVSKIKNDDVKRSLTSLVDAAEASTVGAQKQLQQARKNVEDWFDSHMERVTGWYRRKLQLITLCMALMVCLVTNADTVVLAGTLSTDSVLRESVVAYAQETAKKPLPQGEDLSLTKAVELKKELQQLQLPLGWSGPPPWEIVDWPQAFFKKTTGILLTTFAVSLGAPFWFDMLNKLVNIRAAGKPEKPEKRKKEEESSELDVI